MRTAWPMSQLVLFVCRSLSILLCVRQKELLNEAGCMRGETRYGFNGAIHVDMLSSAMRIDFRQSVENMMQVAKGQADNMIFGILFVLSYVYLLRLPSEALPLRVRTGPCNVNLEGDEVVITLQRRKNKPGGSRLARGCRCRASPLTCPVHVVWPAVKDLPDGALIFPGITANKARDRLREFLHAIGQRHAARYWTHDLRRGHAKDMQLSGKWTFLFFRPLHILRCRRVFV